jgi:hypothetical protein
VIRNRRHARITFEVHPRTYGVETSLDKIREAVETLGFTLLEVVPGERNNGATVQDVALEAFVRVEDLEERPVTFRVPKPLREELREVLNSAETNSNTPDHVLARFLTDCLDAFDHATNERARFWHGEGAGGDHDLTIGDDRIRTKVFTCENADCEHFQAKIPTKYGTTAECAGCGYALRRIE